MVSNEKKEELIKELLEAKNDRYTLGSIIDKTYWEGWNDGYESEDHNYRDMYKNKVVSK